jgi:hypothetical protein
MTDETKKLFVCTYCKRTYEQDAKGVLTETELSIAVSTLYSVPYCLTCQKDKVINLLERKEAAQMMVEAFHKSKYGIV